MNLVSLRTRRAWLAAALASGVFAPWPLAAQQSAPGVGRAGPTSAALSQPAGGPGVAAGKPSWTQAMPDTPGAVALAPQIAPPIPTAADRLPVGLFKLPKNFHVEVYAGDMVQARSLRLDPQGTLFVSTRTLDRIYVVTDKNGRKEVKTLVTGLRWPNGIALHDGTLYIAELSKISKIDDVEHHLNDAKPTVIYSDLPSYEPHGWKFLAVGPDNRLYFNVGAPCNICMPPPTNAQIRSIKLDGSDPQIVAHGIRQVVGIDFQPGTGVMYFTENQRDWLSEDQPQDKLNRVLHPGKDNFGFPYCGGGDIPDPIYGWGHSCNEFTKPVAQLGPHSAPLGMRFYTGHMFPARYHDAIFIARHGSWNRTKKFGGDVVVAFLNRDGTVRLVEPFMTGFLQNNKYVARPVDIEFMRDGSMLLSDDWNGAVYRITYGPPPLSMRR
jgi:glucose/arabinose dehydrogenase